MPKILIWDIETSPIVAAVWGLFNQNINFDSIIDDWYIICAAWKWHGDKEIDTISVLDCKTRFKKDHKDDYHVVKKLHKVLSEADVLVAHNGDKFDLKKFNARALFHGLKPIPHMQTIDTLKVARKHFKLTSNRLDYIGQHLGVGKKVDTPKGLWMDVVKGSREAVETMVNYNIGDITLLEDVYLKLRPFMTTHPNNNIYQWTATEGCPNCGCFELVSQGHRFTRAGKFKRYQCKSCGAWPSEGKSIKRASIR